MRKLFCLATLSLLAGCGASDIAQTNLSQTLARSQTIEFHIAPGTGSTAWNNKEDMLTVTVGDTLHIVNDDTIHHRLHTNGKPCGHGPEIVPGGSFDCIVTRTYNPDTDGALYDHYVGESATFWLKAVTPDQRFLNF